MKKTISSTAGTWDLDLTHKPRAQLTAVAMFCGFALATSNGLAASVPDVPANPFDYVHVTNLAYDPVTGFLTSSTTEPGVPSVCSIKTDTPDPYGNTATVTTSNCAGASGRALFPSRTVTTTFAAVPLQTITVGGTPTQVRIAAGVALTSSQDALSQTTTFETDPRFGTTTLVTRPGNRSTKTELDDFGRVVKVTSADNTSSEQGYCLLNPVGATSPGTLDTAQASNSPGCSAYASFFTSSLVPPRAQMVTFQQDYAVDGSRNGPLKLTFHDARGRVMRVASESFDGSTQPSAYAGAWVATDTVYDAYGNTAIRTSPFFLSNGSTHTTGSFDLEVSLTQVDALGRPVATYSSSTADASAFQTFGTGGSFGYGSYGTFHAAVLRESYAGMVVTETNDKGATRTTEKNTIMSVARMTDANGAQIAYQYDGFGNLIKTTDALQNSRTSTFNLIGDVVASYDPDRGLTTICLDAIGQAKAKQTSAMRGGDAAQACPDNPDNGLTATPVRLWTTYAYDVAGRVAEEYAAESKNDFYYGTYSDHSTNCDSQVSTLCESTMTAGLNIRRYYDSIGRQTGERKDVVGDSITFSKASTFDANTGRLSTVTYPTGVQVQYSYTLTRGFLQGLTLVNGATINPLPDANNVRASSLTLPAGSPLWQANVESADGKYEQTTLGSGNGSGGIVVTNTYEPDTGRPLTISAGPAGSPRQTIDYAVTWDSVGNVATRLDNLGSGTGSVKESFGYDALNRLSSYGVQGPDVAGYERTVQLGYNALGMLLSKSDVGNYSYLAQGGRHPHALQTLAGATNAGYGYDADGNLLSATSGKYAALTYTSEDLVATAGNADQSIRYNWLYDQASARVRETRVNATDTRKTWYDNTTDGLFFESEYDSDLGGTTNRHYLTVDGMTIGVLQTNGALPVLASGQFPTVPSSVTFNKFEYWYRDNLGSLIATSDHLNNATAHYSYDPFGLRRFTGGVPDSGRTLVVDWDATHNSGTARGFTGHEQLDDIGLVNMNGRLYDAGIALVIQADPHVADQYNLQNYSSYAYVLNNPLNATDPTGFDPAGWGSSFGSTGGMSAGGLSDSQAVDAGLIQTPTQFAQFVAAAANYFVRTLKLEVKSQAIAAADGFQDIRTTGSRTNFSTGWTTGRTVGVFLNNGLGLAMTAADLYRLSTPADAMTYAVCPQCMPRMFTPIGSGILHLQTGELSPMDAARNVTAAVAGAPGRVIDDFRTGGWQEGIAQSVNFFLPAAAVTRFTSVGNIFIRGGSALSETASGSLPVVEDLVPPVVPKTMNPKKLIPRQGRDEMTGSKIERYKKAMKAAGGYGEFPPIDAVDVDGQHIITDGHHRAAAAARAQIPEVPVNVRKPVDAAEATALVREAAEAMIHR